MRKFIPALFLFFFTALGAYGQSTTVSGQVTDTGAQSWNNGTIVFTFSPNPQYPVGPYTWTGGALNTTISGVLNGGGAYSISLPSNTAISPIGSKWVAQVCSQASSPCFSTPAITITGSTQTLNITPPAISISLTNPPSAPVIAYSDAEINSANLGSFYYSIPNQTFRVCQAVNPPVCTLFANIGTGGPSGFPRLDQVLDPNVSKAFNLGTGTLSFNNGPLDFSAATKLAIPNLSSAAATATNQLFLDTNLANIHVWNGADNVAALFPAATSFTDGDLLGVKLTAGKYTLQDLGPLNSPSGPTIVKADITNITEGDSLCWDSTASPPIFVNCTPGVPPVVISGTTYNYDGTGSAAPERGEILFFTNAAGAALNLPQPSPSTVINANWFTFIKADAGTLTLTALGTGTFFENGTNTLTVGKGVGCSIFSDPSGLGTYYTKCAMVPLTAGSGVTITPAAYSIAIAATGSGGTITGSGTTNTMTKFTGSAAVGNSSMTDDGTNTVKATNGLSVVTNSLDRQIANANPGTTIHRAVCLNSSQLAITCGTATIGGTAGTADEGAGNSGNVQVCLLGQCVAEFDGNAVVNNWAINSPTTAGRFHDTGSTTEPTGQQAFLIYTANSSGAGGTANIGILNPDVTSGGAAGGGRGTNVQVSGTNTKATANFVPGTGVTLTPVNSGNTTTITVASSGGVSSLTGDGVLTNNSASTGAVTLTKPAQNPNLVYASPSSSSSSNLVQSSFSIQSATNPTTAYTSTTTAGNLLIVMSSGQVDTTSVTSANTWTLGVHQTTHGEFVSVHYTCSAVGGADTVTVHTGGGGRIITQIFEFSGNATTSCLDTFNSSGGSNPAGQTSYTQASSGSVTQPTELVFGYAEANQGSNVTSASAGAGAQNIIQNFTVVAERAVLASVIGTVTTGLTGTQSLNFNIQPPSPVDYFFNTGILTFKLNVTGTGVPTFRQLVNGDLPVHSPQTIYNQTSIGQTAAIPDTVMINPSTSQLFRFNAAINCTASSASATATLNLKWTDTATQAQTLTALATCTTLGSASWNQITQNIRVKSGTNITYGVTIANTPTYDADVRLEQMN